MTRCARPGTSLIRKAAGILSRIREKYAPMASQLSRDQKSNERAHVRIASARRQRSGADRRSCGPNRCTRGAQFQGRATCSWRKVTHSHSTVKGFFGLGDEQKHKTSFSFDADRPEVFASEDHGATPVEFVPVALGKCLTPVLPRALSTGNSAAAIRDHRRSDGPAGYSR